MVKIIFNGNKITFEGHTYPDICAAVSSIMYTTANLLDKYSSIVKENVLKFTDNVYDDYVEMTILYTDDIVDMVVNNMKHMIEDLIEDNNEDKIELYENE